MLILVKAKINHTSRKVRIFALLGEPNLLVGASKRGFAPLFISPPLLLKERGIKGVRLINNIRLSISASFVL